MSDMIPGDQGRLVVVTAPAVPLGTDPNYVMPLRVRWKLKSVQATLTTGVFVGNRIPELTITQDGIEVLRITASQLQAASVIFITGWMEGERALAIVGQTSRVTALPRGYLLNNQAIIAIATVGLDAGDQWTDMYIVAEEWIEPLA